MQFLEPSNNSHKYELRFIVTSTSMCVQKVIILSPVSSTVEYARTVHVVILFLLCNSRSVEKELQLIKIWSGMLY